MPQIGGLAVGGGSVREGRTRRAGGLAAAAVRPGDDLQQVTVRVFEVQAAAAVSAVDHPGLVLRPGSAQYARSWPRMRPKAASIFSPCLLGRRNAGGLSPRRVSAKSSETPLSASTTRKCAKRVAGGNPRIPVRNAADRCWSRHETIVWFSCTLTSVIVPSVVGCERSGPWGRHIRCQRTHSQGSQRARCITSLAVRATGRRWHADMPCV